MEMLLPVLVLLGLTGLLIDDDNNSDSESSGVAGESESATDAPDDENTNNFFELTDEADTEEGTDANDVIRALAGDDVVSGGEGDDRIFLDDGDDVSRGDNPGNDLTRGGAGDDLIFDREGADTLYGDLGADILSSLDRSNAEAIEADSLFGGFGDDLLFGDEGDILTGGEGDDFFGVDFNYGDTPAVIADYEADEEIVLFLPVAAFEGTEVDIVPSESGEDMLVNFGTQTAIVLQGVTDPNTVNLSVDLLEGEIEPDEESDLLVGTEAVDDFNSGPGSDIIVAGRGDDAVDAGGANDYISGGAGDDSLYGNSGHDTIIGGFGDDLLRGGAGDDLIIDSRGSESVRGGSGDDFIQVTDFDIANDEAPDQVSAGEGNDLLFVDDGDDVRLGAGNDVGIVFVEDVAADPVIFRDFDPAEDLLDILVFDSGGEGVLAVTPIGEDTSVTVDGQEVAILTGVTLTTQDIAPDRIIVADVVQTIV